MVYTLVIIIIIIIIIIINHAPCGIRFNCIRVFLNPVNLRSNATYTAKSRKFQYAILLWETETIFERLFKKKKQDGVKRAGGES